MKIDMSSEEINGGAMPNGNNVKALSITTSLYYDNCHVNVHYKISNPDLKTEGV